MSLRRVAIDQGGAAELRDMTCNRRRCGGQGVVDIDGGYARDGDVNRGEHIGGPVSHEKNRRYVHRGDDEDIFDADGGGKAAVRAPETRVERVGFVCLSGSARQAWCLGTIPWWMDCVVRSDGS